MTALSIARPLKDALAATPFEGRVWSVFRRACNLIDANQRVVALVAPELGRGPFSITLDAPAFFEALACNQPVWIDARRLTLGNRQLNLEQADVWEPGLPRPWSPLTFAPAVAAVLQNYADWPHLSRLSPTEKIIVRAIQKAAVELQRAIVQNDNIKPPVGRLAGLGLGLTPGGDDYIVGVMAALWLVGREELAAQIERVAAPRTTVLSAAFLSAAAKGQFVEPWHKLAQALVSKDPPKVAEAAQRVTRFGAYSGYDALAGFAATLLSLV